MPSKASLFESPATEIWVVAMENEGVAFEVARTEQEALHAVEQHAKRRLRASVARYTVDESSFRKFP